MNRLPSIPESLTSLKAHELSPLNETATQLSLRVLEDDILTRTGGKIAKHEDYESSEDGFFNHDNLLRGFLLNLKGNSFCNPSVETNRSKKERTGEKTLSSPQILTQWGSPTGKHEPPNVGVTPPLVESTAAC